MPYWDWSLTDDIAENPLFDGSDLSIGGDGAFVEDVVSSSLFRLQRPSTSQDLSELEVDASLLVHLLTCVSTLVLVVLQFPIDSVITHVVLLVTSVTPSSERILVTRTSLPFFKRPIYKPLVIICELAMGKKSTPSLLIPETNFKSVFITTVTLCKEVSKTTSGVPLKTQVSTFTMQLLIVSGQYGKPRTRQRESWKSLTP